MQERTGKGRVKARVTEVGGLNIAELAEEKVIEACCGSNRTQICKDCGHG